MNQALMTSVLALSLAVGVSAGCGSKRDTAKQRQQLDDAIECLDQPESCIISKLGRPDLELMGPNPTDKKFVYKDAQLTIQLLPRDAPKVFAVGTGAVTDASHFGGDYAAPIDGIRHGDSVDALTKAWGPGQPATPLDASAGNTYLTYAGKRVTKDGRKINVTVHYRNDKRGIYHAHFHTW
jgi:hypothetical protein